MEPHEISYSQREKSAKEMKGGTKFEMAICCINEDQFSLRAEVTRLSAQTFHKTPEGTQPPSSVHIHLSYPR